MTETFQPHQNKGRAVLRVVLPIALILVGVAAFAAMVMTKEPPRKVETSYLGPLVESIAAPARSTRVVVTGQGAVRPAAEIDLVPQVAGTVVWKSARLETGGYFRAGDLLVQIDPRDYELAVQAADAERAQAAYAREIAVGEAGVARSEWALVAAAGGAAAGTDRPSVTPDPLVLHVPQLQTAEARLRAAEARVAEAQLRLERTKLYAPFDGRVRQTSLDRSQYVQAGHPVARLYSIETAEIVVPVPDEELEWIDLPAANWAPAVGIDDAQVRGGSVEELPDRATTGPWPQAVVTAEYAGRQYEWRGRVVRAEAELDPRSRMAHVVVEIGGPHDTSTGEAIEPPVVGLFIDVAIRGRAIEGVRSVPRAAVRPPGVVWTAGADGIMRVRPAEVIHRGREDVLVRFEMSAEERVIVSRLKGATDGMKVRLQSWER